MSSLTLSANGSARMSLSRPVRCLGDIHAGSLALTANEPTRTRMPHCLVRQLSVRQKLVILEDDQAEPCQP